MEESPSYRQVGRESPGRLQKGSTLDKSDHPLTPVFGSQAYRFSVSKPGLTFLPRATTPLPLHKVLGCMGKSRRFKPNRYMTAVPGPGTYTWKAERRNIIIKSVFLSKETRSLSPIKQVPAPGQYDPKEASSSRSVASVFRSNVKRIEGPPESTTPAPWHYTPSFALIHKSNTTVSYKEPSTRPVHVNVYNSLSKPVPEESPGPGSYEIPREKSEGAMPSAVFQSGNERFARQQEASPAPGTYDIGSKEKERERASGAAFRSDTERFWRKEVVQRPGPAFYKPSVLQKRRSFLLNMHKNWVG